MLLVFLLYWPYCCGSVSSSLAIRCGRAKRTSVRFFLFFFWERGWGLGFALLVCALPWRRTSHIRVVCWIALAQEKCFSTNGARSSRKTCVCKSCMYVARYSSGSNFVIARVCEAHGLPHATLVTEGQHIQLLRVNRGSTNDHEEDCNDACLSLME